MQTTRTRSRPRRDRQVRGQLGLAPAGANVEDPAPMQVAEGGGEALALVERVLVDAEHPRAVQTQPLLGLPLGKLGVDARHRPWRYLLPISQDRGTDAVTVTLVNSLPPGLCAVPAGQDPGQAAARSCGCSPGTRYRRQPITNSLG